MYSLRTKFVSVQLENQDSEKNKISELLAGNIKGIATN